MRVYELARELQISNKMVIAKLRELGYEVTNHMSVIDEGQARRVRAALSPETTENVTVQEKRIGGAVIRRRRRAAKPQQPPAEAEEAPKAEGEARPAEAEEAPKAEGAPESEATAAAEAKAEPEQPADTETEAEAKPAPTPPKRKGGARIVDRIEPPPVPQRHSPGGPPGAAPGAGPTPGGDRPKRRVVVKRMYRPTKGEEAQLKKIRQARQKKKSGHVETIPAKAEKRKVRIEESITVGDLAKAMGVKAGDIIKKFIEMGMMVTINQAIDPETAAVIASEYGHEVEQVGFQEEEFLKVDVEDKPEDLEPRPPVVTVMGHVDHGKTSILDRIRKTRVAAGEAGGITQHIGAYQVEIPQGKITFIDTPGHEAFTAMRARGAQATDIVVLVVAANDGVMPQTIEAIQHAKAADVPIVVAINKIDLPDANPDHVKSQLAEHELVPEDWGGDVQMVPVSAKTGEGIEDLLEAILLQAEMMELKANPKRPAQAIVIESRVDKGRGPMATVIVRTGTLRRGDIAVAGTAYGRIRALITDTGQQIKEAPPSTPVAVLGFNAPPPAGEWLYVVENERIARQIAENRERKERERQMHQQSRVSLENIFEKMQEGEVKELAVVLKADVQGSLEAIRQAIEKLTEQEKEVRVRIVAGGVGAITENDVNLASASDALVIGFNTRPDAKASRTAQAQGVEIRVYNIIYDLLDDLKAALQGMLAPEEKEVSLGWAKVLQIFPIKGVGTVAGSRVESGKFVRGARVRLVRDGQVLYDGQIANLRRYQQDVDEVLEGQECGILLENFNKVREGDELECYQVVQVERELGAAG